MYVPLTLQMFIWFDHLVANHVADVTEWISDVRNGRGIANVGGAIEVRCQHTSGDLHVYRKLAAKVGLNLKYNHAQYLFFFCDIEAY